MKFLVEFYGIVRHSSGNIRLDSELRWPTMKVISDQKVKIVSFCKWHRSKLSQRVDRHKNKM